MSAPSPDILHVDADLIVAVKPAGLPCVPGRPAALHDCLWTRLCSLYPDTRVVHRLDMATSGLMLFARGAAAQRALSRAFAERQVDKHYEAVVQGPWTLGDEGRIDLPLAPDWPRRPLQRVCAETGRPSTTRWWRRTRAAAARVGLRLQPVTGRTHQLRLHLAALGHPIVGDALYGAPPRSPGDPLAGPALEERLLLHASELGFTHPGTGLPLRFVLAAPFGSELAGWASPTAGLESDGQPVHP